MSRTLVTTRATLPSSSSTGVPVTITCLEPLMFCMMVTERPFLSTSRVTE